LGMEETHLCSDDILDFVQYGQCSAPVSILLALEGSNLLGQPQGVPIQAASIVATISATLSSAAVVGLAQKVLQVVLVDGPGGCVPFFYSLLLFHPWAN